MCFAPASCGRGAPVALALAALFTGRPTVAAQGTREPHLVRGIVVAYTASPDGDGGQATVEVVSCFTPAGPRPGDRFRDAHTKEDVVGLGAERPFKVGQRGVWSLATTGRVPTVVEAPALPWRCRVLDDEEAYVPAVRVCEAVGRYAVTPKAQRADLLDELMGLRSWGVTAWAVHACQRDRGVAGLPSLYTLLTLGGLPVDAAVRLDQALSDLAPSVWIKSPRRNELLTSLSGRQLNELGALLLFNHLNNSRNQGSLSDEEVLRYLTTATANQHAPLSVRRHALYFMSLVRGNRERDTAARWVLTQLATETARESRRAYAASLGRFRPYSDERQADIRALLKNEPDPAVASSLETALTR